MKRFGINILILAFFAGGAYLFRTPLIAAGERISRDALPCWQPISYQIDRVDPEFNLSKADLLAALEDAEAIWEGPTGRNLFRSKPNGGLKINLIYDSRQAATEKLNVLGVAVEGTRASYEEIKARYQTLLSEYQTNRAALEARVAEFEIRKRTYQSKVEEWNRKGGAPKRVFDEMNREKDDLNTEVDRIRRAESELNAQAEDVNAAVAVLNRLAAELNLNVAHYNNIGEELGSEFEEGIYRRDARGEAIDIFQFDSRARLVRVLAHELGHALDLPHVENPHAIMYRLNKSQNDQLTEDDIAALKKRCRWN